MDEEGMKWSWTARRVSSGFMEGGMVAEICVIYGPTIFTRLDGGVLVETYDIKVDQGLGAVTRWSLTLALAFCMSWVDSLTMKKSILPLLLQVVDVLPACQLLLLVH